MNVRLKLADGSFFEQDGKIDFLDVIVDPRTDGQILRATFKNSGRLLTDGQTVRVIVQRAASEKSSQCHRPPSHRIKAAHMSSS